MRKQPNVDKRRLFRSRLAHVLGIALLLAGGTLLRVAPVDRGAATRPQAPGSAHAPARTGALSSQTTPGGISLVVAKQPTPVALAGAGFTFTAAGDYGQTAYTTANLRYIARSGASFHLALGDYSY